MEEKIEEKITTKKMTPDELLRLFRDGKFSEIIGVEESEQIDFKRKNYNLGIEPNQYEFAKDIAAIANSGGGIICVGFSNGEDPSKLVSYAKEAFPLTTDKLDKQQIIQKLKNKLVPSLPNNLVSFEFFKEGEDKYFLTIIIKETPDEIKPLIVPWKNNQTEYFLCPHRNGPETQSILSINQIHDYISTGLRKKLSGKEDSGVEEVKNKLDFITDKLDSLALGNKETIDPISEYLEHAKQTIDSEQGFFYIAAIPTTSVKMNNFWDKDKNMIYNLLLDPPTLRRNGWNLHISVESGERPAPISSRWESANGRSKLTLVDKQGIIFSAGEIDGFLNWGIQDYKLSEQYEGILINNYAFVEYIYSFVDFFLKFCKDKNILTTQYNFRFGFVLPDGVKVNLFRPPHLGHYYRDIIGPITSCESDYVFHRADEADTKHVAGDIINIIYVALFGQTDESAYLGKDEDGPFVEVERYKKP